MDPEEYWSHPLILLQRKSSQGNAGELNLVAKIGESWEANQLCKYPGPEPGSPHPPHL